MARAEVEKFLRDYDGNVNNLKKSYEAERRSAVTGYTGATLSKDEQELLIRGDAHEIKQYLQDAYGAALSVNIP